MCHVRLFNEVSRMIKMNYEALNFRIYIKNLLRKGKLLQSISLSFAFIFGLAFSSMSYGERVVTDFPFRADFDRNDYNDMVKLTQGATHTWDPNGGWSGGAAKFTPPTLNEGYCGLGQFSGIDRNVGNVRRLNVRFLIKHGPTFHTYAATNKLVIMNRAAGTLRPMIISKNHQVVRDWRTYRPCHGTWCVPPVTDNEGLKIGPDPGSRKNEWISVELEADLDRRVINLYIYTADGEVSGLYTVNPFIDDNDSGAGFFERIDVLGGYFGKDYGRADAGNYFMIDELEIDSQYIGPPQGFVGSVVAPPSYPGNIQ